MGTAAILRMGIKQFCELSEQKSFVFVPSFVTFWGTLVANDAKIAIFAFY